MKLGMVSLLFFLAGVAQLCLCVVMLCIGVLSGLSVIQTTTTMLLPAIMSALTLIASIAASLLE